MNIILTLLISSSLFVIVLGIIGLIHNLSHSESLYKDWQKKLYEIFFKEKAAKDIAKKLRIPVDSYLHNCKLCGEVPNLEKLVIYRIIGYIVFVLSYMIAIFGSEIIMLIPGTVIYLFLVIYPTNRIKSKVAHKRTIIGDELPRFLDLFHTALVVNISPEQALELTSDSLPQLELSKELKRILAEVKLGYRNWQSALKQLAMDYNQTLLTDFVLDLLNAHNTGVSIAESVKKTSENIKRANLLEKKERANKLSNTIMFPIMIFKMVPLIVILGIPIVYQLF